tara:strand:- start:21263 stop:22249 length:987 start_codon:yes stop_codon:yes gene_type:complete
MISSFKQYLVEETKTIFFTWGRMNPPTIGHGKLLDKLSQKAGSNPYRIYVTQSNDPKSNPLTYMEKIKTLRKMFPKHARSIISNKKLKTLFQAVTSLYDEGFKSIVMLAGSDRIVEFDTLLKKYNGKKSTHGFYNFQNIKVISAGQRDPDSEGVEGMSASKMRGFAKDNDFTAFSQGLPKGVSNPDTKSLFNLLRTRMGLKEEKSFKRHLKLDEVSKDREAYIRGRLFSEGDEIVIKDTDEVAIIKVCGSNYVIVETSDGTKLRKWITDIGKIEEAPDYHDGTYNYKPGRTTTTRRKISTKTSIKPKADNRNRSMIKKPMTTLMPKKA